MADLKKYGLTLKQKMWVDYYLGDELMGNATQAYIQAYGLDAKKPEDYALAKSCGHENLAKPDIIAYMNDKILELGITPQLIDANLSFIMRQKKDLGSSLGASRELNKVLGRIIDKSEQVVHIDETAQKPLTPDEIAKRDKILAILKG